MIKEANTQFTVVEKKKTVSVNYKLRDNYLNLSNCALQLLCCCPFSNSLLNT